MKREIKFRVQRDDTKGWLYFTLGDLISGHAVIEENYGYIPDSWSEWTGLKDKNGKDLFEGDNLNVVDGVVVETIGGYPRTEPEGRTETIKYERGAFWWGEELLWEVAEHGEVISNIYESETR